MGKNFNQAYGPRVSIPFGPMAGILRQQASIYAIGKAFIAGCPGVALCNAAHRHMGGDQEARATPWEGTCGAPRKGLIEPGFRYDVSRLKVPEGEG